jgi:hypothetical protein
MSCRTGQDRGDRTERQSWRAWLSHDVGDGARESSLVRLGNIEVAVFVHECRVLLLLVGNAWWERSDVPMDVRTALVAPERQHVETLGGYCSRYGASEFVHSALELDVLVLSEVPDNVGAMVEGGEDRVAEQCW